MDRDPGLSGIDSYDPFTIGAQGIESLNHLGIESLKIFSCHHDLNANDLDEFRGAPVVNRIW
jgi:hypothetical protein